MFCLENFTIAFEVREHESVAKARLVTPGAWLWVMSSFITGIGTHQADLYTARGVLRGRQRKTHLKQYRHGIQMTRLEKWSFAFIDFFFPCRCTACYENRVPSFHLSVTHQKIFSTISWASNGPYNNRHLTNICWIELKGTEFL